MFQDMQIPVIPISDGQTQQLIAHVQESLSADRAYDIGDNFIFLGKLYKVTAAISQGDFISIGSGSGDNADEAEPIADQMPHRILQKNATARVTFSAASTWASTDAMICVPEDGVYLIVANGEVDGQDSSHNGALQLVSIGLTNSTHSTFTPIKASAFTQPKLVASSGASQGAYPRTQCSVVLIRDCTAGEYISVGGMTSDTTGFIESNAQIQMFKIG